MHYFLFTSFTNLNSYILPYLLHLTLSYKFNLIFFYKLIKLYSTNWSTTQPKVIVNFNTITQLI